MLDHQSTKRFSEHSVKDTHFLHVQGVPHNSQSESWKISIIKLCVRIKLFLSICHILYFKNINLHSSCSDTQILTALSPFFFIHRALLLGKWEVAVDLILKPREGGKQQSVNLRGSSHEGRNAQLECSFIVMMVLWPVCTQISITKAIDGPEVFSSDASLKHSAKLPYECLDL